DETVDDAKNPDEGRDADRERHRDEETGDEAAATPLHRSNYNQRAAIARKSATPRAIRYQANGANPRRRTTARNGRTTTSEAINAMMKPTAISAARSAERWWRTFRRLCANAAIIVGIARKNENSAAAARSSPISMPPTMVAPDRETPGTIASTWHAQIP